MPRLTLPNGRALSCVAQAAHGRGGTRVQCHEATKIDWNTLCHVSCSALLGGGAIVLYGEVPPHNVEQEKHGADQMAQQGRLEQEPSLLRQGFE